MTQAFNLSQFANKVNTSGQASLTTAVTGTLPIANGGTNSTATPTAGGIVYGTGTAQAVTSAGTTGQILYSNGASAPSFAAPPVSGFSNMVVLTVTNANYSIPASKLKVTVVGGGGDGGEKAEAFNNNRGGGGGGGGGAAIEVITGLIVGDTVNVTVGGATTSFGSYLSATGGANGGTITGGVGGAGTGGDINMQGSDGTNGTSSTSTTYSGGFGGSSILGGSVRAGNAGKNYGGGGGGQGGTGSLGTGSTGVVIIEY